MNAEDHATHAEQELKWADGDDSDYHLAKAQAHATLALALEQRNTNVWLRDIGDQLDQKMPHSDRIAVQNAVWPDAHGCGPRHWWIHSCGKAAAFTPPMEPTSSSCGHSCVAAGEWRPMFVAAR